jgi:hypothetical protein
MKSISSITLYTITKKSPLHFLQKKYKKQRKPNSWWERTSNIQAFRLSRKKYKSSIFNIQSLLPELLPNVFDFTVGSKEYHKNWFNQCIEQLNHITIQKTTLTQIPRYSIFNHTLDTILRHHTYNIIEIDIRNILYYKCVYIQSKQLYPNRLFKNIHYIYLLQRPLY